MEENDDKKGASPPPEPPDSTQSPSPERPSPKRWPPARSLEIFGFALLLLSIWLTRRPDNQIREDEVRHLQQALEQVRAENRQLQTDNARLSKAFLAASASAAVDAGLDALAPDKKWFFQARCVPSSIRVFHTSAALTPEIGQSCVDAGRKLARDMGGTEWEYRTLKAEIEAGDRVQVWRIQDNPRIECACSMVVGK